MYRTPYIFMLCIALGCAATARAQSENAAVDTTASVTAPHPMAGDVISYARSFMGRPYRSGGKGPAGFDCSGFTSYVFRNFNVALGASSRAQYTQGTAVEAEDIRPGDLLFFGGRRAGASAVGHVGLAVDVSPNGTVTFIHAANGGGIRLDRYPDGGYYSRRYIGARRVLTDDTRAHPKHTP